LCPFIVIQVHIQNSGESCLHCVDNNNNKFDNLLRDSVQQITNSDLSDIKWIQASLPVRDGGLGIRRVTSLALPAFVASAASTLSLQADILANCAVLDSNFLRVYLTRWSTQFGDVPEVLPTKHPFWDRPGVLTDKALYS